MPEVRSETIKIEGGIILGGEVIYDNPSLFTELPKLSLTPIFDDVVTISIISRNLIGFIYKVMYRWKGILWRNGTNTIPVIWIAIQER